MFTCCAREAALLVLPVRVSCRTSVSSACADRRSDSVVEGVYKMQHYDKSSSEFWPQEFHLKEQGHGTAFKNNGNG